MPKRQTSTDMMRVTSVELGKDLDATLAQLRLVSIDAHQLPFERADETALVRRNSVEVLALVEGAFVLKLEERVSFKPHGPFKLDLEVLGTFVTNGQPTVEDIESNKVDLAYPLLCYSAGLISIISEKFLGVPIVIVPRLED